MMMMMMMMIMTLMMMMTMMMMTTTMMSSNVKQNLLKGYWILKSNKYYDIFCFAMLSHSKIINCYQM